MKGGDKIMADVANIPAAMWYGECLMLSFPRVIRIIHGATANLKRKEAEDKDGFMHG